jgi:hypothetical protein
MSVADIALIVRAHEKKPFFCLFLKHASLMQNRT